MIYVSLPALVDSANSPSITRYPITIPRELWGNQTVRIATWLVDIGDHVLPGDVLVEVLRPGIVGDVRAPREGVVLEIRHLENEDVTANDILGWLELYPSPPSQTEALNEC